MKKSLALLLVAALLLGVFALIGCNKPAGTDAQQLSVCLIVPYSFGDKSFMTPLWKAQNVSKKITESS